MVLSLVELSLRSIMNGIKNGTIRHPHLLSPRLRELVLDTAVKQGLTNHPDGLAIFTSIDFLNGMSLISAKICTEDDIVFLQSLAASLATKLPNGETVGAAITKLYLTGHRFRMSTMPDLIARCPNTTTLALRVINNWDTPQPACWPLNENENSECNDVMENMVELSLCDWNTRILNIQGEIINFKQLTTLKLDNCRCRTDEWRVLLGKIRPTLQNLHLIDLGLLVYHRVFDLILPFSMPQLKSFEVVRVDRIQDGRHWVRIDKCNKAFVDNLIGCPQLRQVHLMLDESSTDEECLVRLANMDIELKIKIVIFLCGETNNATVFDSSSRFKLVSIFHEKMESFGLSVLGKWDPQISTALEDVVGTCSNLAKFLIRLPRIRLPRIRLPRIRLPRIRLPRIRYEPSQPEIESEEEMKRVNKALGKFFCNSERGLKLKDLSLDGNFDEAVMSAAFENCLNLYRLEISGCSALRDQHLIDWVSCGGGKLTHLNIIYCDNVTSEGIIPILAKSAESLLVIDVYLKDTFGGRNWKTLARNICPNARLPPDQRISSHPPAYIV